MKNKLIAYDSQDPADQRQEQAIRMFKSRLAAAKRRTRFLYGRGTAAFADELSAALAELQDGLYDPRKGVELLAEFFRSDEVLFNKCDDSDGNLGQIFTIHACKLFVHYAAVCSDKRWLADLILQLQHDDDYGVRDCLFDVASQFLPEPEMRSLVERLWKLGQREPTEYRQRHWLYLIESLARQMHDAALYERASRAAWSEGGAAQYIDIAKVYFESGDAATALTWLEKIPLVEQFEADKRDELLLALYQRLGCSDDATKTAWRIFRRFRHETTFEQLLEIVGCEERQQILDEETKLILQSPGISYTDAEFLLWCGKLDEAEQYLLARAKELDGDQYYAILPLAEAMEREERYLAATVLYRSLLESILARAISKYYAHGVRYLRRLDELAQLVENWRTFIPHNEYFLQLLGKHARKSSFWGRYEAKGRRQGGTKRGKVNSEGLE